jgi:hypothetical protein
MSHYFGNWYIIVTTNYATKCVEAKTLHTNIVVVNVKFFLLDHVVIQFGYPRIVVTN